MSKKQATHDAYLAVVQPEDVTACRDPGASSAHRRGLAQGVRDAPEATRPARERLRR
jgi:hypothetical protein